MRRFFLLTFALIAVSTLVAGTLRAQQDEKSTFIRFVENQLSTPNRQIRLNGLDGVLSSNVSLTSITIADRDGIWLNIEEPKLRWSRTGLLRGRLDIESLTATRIDFLRKPLPDDSLPTPEAQPFTIPELPIAVRLNELAVPRISFGEDVFGLASEASITGRFILVDGGLDTRIAMERLGEVGGALNATIAYTPDNEMVAMDIALSEPQNGIVASALGLIGRPPVALTVRGNAPLSNLAVDLDFDVDQRRILDGRLTFTRPAEDLLARLDAAGPIASLMNEEFQNFLGSQSTLGADFVFAEDGSTAIRDLVLQSGVVDARISALRLPDGFLGAMDADISLRNAPGQKVEIPGSGTAVDVALVSVKYDGDQRESWTAQIEARNIESGDLRIETARIDADGLVRNLRSAGSRSVTFRATGGANDITSDNPDLARAVGERVAINTGGDWRSGRPVRLEIFDLSGETFDIAARGLLDDFSFEGLARLEIEDLVAFAPITERDLSGAVRLQLDGKVEPISGAFDIAIDGETTDLTLGDVTLDKLLAGQTRLLGGVARSETGLAFNRFSLENPALSFVADGPFSSESSGLRAEAKLKDLSVISPDSSGVVDLTISLEGAAKPFDAAINLTMPEGTLLKRTVRDLSFSLDGRTTTSDFEGRITGSGFLNDAAVLADGGLLFRDNAFALEELNADIAGTKLSGTVRRNADGLVDGRLNVDASDLSNAAALFLAEASGSLKGLLDFKAQGERQTVAFNGEGGNLQYSSYRIASAKIDATIDDAFSKPLINANIDAQGVKATAVDIRTLKVTAKTEGTTTDFQADALIDAVGGTRVETNGKLVQGTGAIEVLISTLEAVSPRIKAELRAPAQIISKNGMVEIRPVDLAVGNGSVRLDGMISETLDLNGRVDALPLEIANAFVASLDARGRLSGTFEIAGTPAEPRGTFQIEGDGLSVRQARDFGLDPITLSASGTTNGTTIALDRAAVQNGQGLSLTASGTVPLSGRGLNVAANGTVPLSLGERFLADRGTSLSGRVDLRVTATGSLTKPDLEGLVTLNDGSISDPLTNARLNNVGVMIGLRGQTLTITRASANLAGGGTLQASGRISLERDLPANLTIRLDRARYSDGELVQASATGTLDVTGNLARDPLISGTLFMEEIEITVPETFGSGPELLDVSHEFTDFATRQTLARIEKATPSSSPSSRPSVVQLNITLNAPRRIFVRGRGLDAELGGQLQLLGPATDIRPIGGFELIRGRLVILGKRLDLDSGEVTFAGDLDPLLNFVASTGAGDVDASITLQGRASNLSVTFSSVPELPQDEVLALIIFDRGIADLSPVQIARLATVAAELVGGGGPGVFDTVRSGIGLDDLDVISTEDGNAAVKAGKYVSDNVYLGVEAGRETEAVINLDLTDDITARGAVKSDGNTSIGIFFERDF
ncbi:MAG: translocation/assembly module TamB domain-containing protein [Pseudomonadota bacterium]